MIKKIVWASDGSKDSLHALSHAESLARVFGAGIVGLYVIPEYFEVSTMDEFESERLDLLASWIREKESKGSNRLSSIAAEMRGKGLDFTTRIKQGVPYHRIIETAEEEKADLIVIGKGRAHEKNVLGGTALKVLRRSKTPVYIAKGEEPPKKIKRILVPTDLYRMLSRDLEATLGIARQIDADIYSLNIVVTGEGKYPPKLIELARGDAYNKLTEQVEDAKLEDRVETIVETARNAWTGIVDFAKHKDIDLIVMTTYGDYKMRKDDFLGNTTERVVQEAHCPVITVRPL
ncbi:MAG: universal stress protein [Candidatus Dadabacteria bacterium]|nr:universal stress protein [Candidatus Dadabacteria bacterium]